MDVRLYAKPRLHHDTADFSMFTLGSRKLRHTKIRIDDGRSIYSFDSRLGMRSQTFRNFERNDRTETTTLWY